MDDQRGNETGLGATGPTAPDPGSRSRAATSERGRKFGRPGAIALRSSAGIASGRSAARRSYPVAIGPAVIDLLVRARWLPDRDVHDPVEVAEAAAAMLRDARRN